MIDWDLIRNRVQAPCIIKCINLQLKYIEHYCLHNLYKPVTQVNEFRDRFILPSRENMV